MIEITITANSLEEFRHTLSGLLGSASTGPTALEVMQEGQAPKKTRAKAAAAAEAEAGSTETEDAEAMAAEKDRLARVRERQVSEQKIAQKAQTEFQRQVAEAVAEDEPDLGLDDGPVYTAADAKAALGIYNGKHGAKATRDNLLMKFTGADGQPVERFSALQEKDYSAFVTMATAA